MKKSTSFRKGEEGYVLVFVTLALAMTMLVIPPLLNFIGGAGRTAQIREDRMLTVYAADAGIEDGYYRILGNSSQLDSPWNISDVNGCNVTIEIQQETEDILKITSTATSWEGVNVKIEAYVASVDYSYLFDNALSSYGDIILRPNVDIYGNVTYNGELDNKGTIYGSDTNQMDLWPDEDVLKSYYKDDIGEQINDPYTSSIKDVDQDLHWGPIYSNSVELDIHSTDDTTPTMYLDGTLYVTGDLDIGKTEHEFVLDLDGEGEGEEGTPQTIFCEQTIDIGGQCIIKGSGCIIAIGDVFFSPQVESGPNDFVFVMSVSGNLQAQPQGEFYGAMAGLVEILYQPGSTIHWRDPEGIGLNFPEGDPMPGIRGYIIRD